MQISLGDILRTVGVKYICKADCVSPAKLLPFRWHSWPPSGDCGPWAPSPSFAMHPPPPAAFVTKEMCLWHSSQTQKSSHDEDDGFHLSRREFLSVTSTRQQLMSALGHEARERAGWKLRWIYPSPHETSTRHLDFRMPLVWGGQWWQEDWEGGTPMC